MRIPFTAFETGHTIYTFCWTKILFAYWNIDIIIDIRINNDITNLHIDPTQQLALFDKPILGDMLDDIQNSVHCSENSMYPLHTWRTKLNYIVDKQE
jgi:hypothetical protein